MTGALLMEEAQIIAMPIDLAMRRVRHGVVRRGSEDRQILDVTSGEGSEDHAQFASEMIRGLSTIPTVA